MNNTATTYTAEFIEEMMSLALATGRDMQREIVWGAGQVAKAAAAARTSDPTLETRVAAARAARLANRKF